MARSPRATSAVAAPVADLAPVVAPAAARNAYLDASTQMLDDHVALLGISTFSVPGSAAQEHGAIGAAIAVGDADGAERAARAHIRGALRARLTIVDRRRG